MGEYLWDCKTSLNLEFSSCKKLVASVGEIDPGCFMLVEKKGQTTEKLQDRYGHVIPLGELYLEVRYLHKSHSCHPNKKKFKVLNHTVYISPGEIFETFVQFDDDLTWGIESYSKYLNLA